MFATDHNGFEEESICRIDEVGRGLLAGPAVTRAIMISKDREIIEGITDSKKLSEEKRTKFKDMILNQTLAYSVSLVDQGVIDEINIRQAARLSIKGVTGSLKTGNNKFIRPDLIVIDAEEIDTDIKQVSFAKDGQKLHPIPCASIAAKVIKDEYMKEMAVIYLQYGFEKRKGYGTKLHREMILEYSECPLHRRTFLGELYENEKKPR